MSETLTLRIRTTASPERVHQALTTAADLEAWLAEHASAAPFGFWGRYTPEGDAPHQEVVHVDARTLRFTWKVGGETTDVAFSLTPWESGTLITLEQSHFPGWESAVAEDSVLGHLYTYWTLGLANLVDHVEGRQVANRIDFTSAEMRGTVHIAAEPEVVARSLVDAESYERWFGARIDIEAWVGGRVAMGGLDANPHPATVLVYEPGKRMDVDWHGMVSGWELEGTDGGTRLTFVQSGFDPANPPYSAWGGWLAGVVELRRFHELADWRPMWLAPDVPGLPEGILSR
ncbi:hypothetical protein GCM10022243_59550 [Saccharothrix violaceirubra]|uniref:Uncharacterized protein YndB with AHSA1/START domain n=1 Tax=Saccharothrix violaceirubra TaxID=413306 RepID=A0A7W7T2W4_9PSEU|nr:SRPBCC domain-containing protein [Saccharothrix violaceirubra]MBB4964992.1 uncharacterized protein YndB with AHSA1/START domain [Saccharothrix violaceirubra]